MNVKIDDKNKALLAGSTSQAFAAETLAFPATQAPSADANTLDDYEEGTWTPVLGGAGGTSGQGYALQAGAYTKIGDMVFCACYVQFTNKGTITGNLRLSGLPFTVSATYYSNGSYGDVAFWILTAILTFIPVTIFLYQFRPVL